MTRVDPLPHQLEAVYAYFLSLPRGPHQRSKLAVTGAWSGATSASRLPGSSQRRGDVPEVDTAIYLGEKHRSS